MPSSLAIRTFLPGSIVASARCPQRRPITCLVSDRNSFLSGNSLKWRPVKGMKLPNKAGIRMMAKKGRGSTSRTAMPKKYSATQVLRDFPMILVDVTASSKWREEAYNQVVKAFRKGGGFAPLPKDKLNLQVERRLVEIASKEVIGAMPFVIEPDTSEISYYKKTKGFQADADEDYTYNILLHIDHRLEDVLVIFEGVMQLFPELFRPDLYQTIDFALAYWEGENSGEEFSSTFSRVLEDSWDVAFKEKKTQYSFEENLPEGLSISIQWGLKPTDTNYWGKVYPDLIKDGKIDLTEMFPKDIIPKELQSFLRTTDKAYKAVKGFAGNIRSALEGFIDRLPFKSAKKLEEEREMQQAELEAALIRELLTQQSTLALQTTGKIIDTNSELDEESLPEEPLKDLSTNGAAQEPLEESAVTGKLQKPLEEPTGVQRRVENQETISNSVSGPGTTKGSVEIEEEGKAEVKSTETSREERVATSISSAIPSVSGQVQRIRGKRKLRASKPQEEAKEDPETSRGLEKERVIAGEKKDEKPQEEITEKLEEEKLEKSGQERVERPEEERVEKPEEEKSTSGGKVSEKLELVVETPTKKIYRRQDAMRRKQVPPVQDTQPAPSPPKKSTPALATAWYVILDTNIYLEDGQLTALNVLIEAARNVSKVIEGGEESAGWWFDPQVYNEEEEKVMPLVLVNPLAVVDELDGIKKTPDKRGLNARAALRLLAEELRERPPWLRGQLAAETIPVEEFGSPTADNKILACSCYFNQMVKRPAKVILLTADNALQVKAVGSYNVDTMDAKTFMKKYLTVLRWQRTRSGSRERAGFASR